MCCMATKHRVGSTVFLEGQGVLSKWVKNGQGNGSHYLGFMDVLGFRVRGLRR